MAAISRCGMQASTLARSTPFSSQKRSVFTKASASGPSSSGQIPALNWPKEDTETPKEVFAINGPAPERVNGRVSMIAFVSAASAELSTHTPVLEQFGSSWFGVVIFSALITFASIMPKISSGVSLKELLASATGANMKGEGTRAYLEYFDTNNELWAGRMAMLGITGLVVVEAVSGKSFF